MARAAPWTAEHRFVLWKLAEALPDGLEQIDDGGCGPTLRPKESLGDGLKRQRRSARNSKHCREEVRCVPHEGDYVCSLSFGLDGPPPEQEFTIDVQLRLRPDGSRADSHVACYLAG